MANDNKAPIKLKLLVTVVNKGKSEFFCDFLSGFNCNSQLSIRGRGGATNQILNMLGLKENKKSVIFSVVRADKVEEILNGLTDKFNSVDNGKGIAFTIPMDGTIGVLSYRFLSDYRGE